MPKKRLPTAAELAELKLRVIGEMIERVASLRPEELEEAALALCDGDADAAAALLNRMAGKINELLRQGL